MNPAEWIKSKLKKKKKLEEAEVNTVLQLPEGSPAAPKQGERAKGSRYWYEQAQRQKASEQSRVDAEKAAKEKAEQDLREHLDEIRQQTERARRAEEDSSRWKQFGSSKGRGETDEEFKRRTGTNPSGTSNPELNDLLSKLSPKDRKRYERMAQEAASSEAKARLEARAYGVGPEEVEYHKIWQAEHYVDPSTGQNVPKGTPNAQFVPGQWVIQPVKKPLSPMELRLKTAVQQSQLQQIKDLEKQRKLAPYKSAVKDVMKAGTMLAGTATLGVAGTAQSIMPGRGPKTGIGTGMLTPSVPISMYAAPRQNIDLSGLKQPPIVISQGTDLSPLRQGVLPRTQLQAQRPIPVTGVRIPVTGTPHSDNLEHLRSASMTSVPKAPVGRLDHLKAATLPGNTAYLRGSLPKVGRVVPDLSKLKNLVHRKAGIRGQT